MHTQLLTNVNMSTNVNYNCKWLHTQLLTNVNVSRGTHPRPPAAAGRDACVTTPLSVNNRTAEGGRAAVVRAVVADGAGGGSGAR